MAAALLFVPQVSRADPPPGMIAYYPLDGTAQDSGANAFHGTLNGTAPAADRNGKANQAVSFNGLSDFIDLGNPAAFNFTENFTLSAWVKLTGPQNYPFLIAKADAWAGDSAPHSFALGLGAIGGLYGFLKGGGANEFEQVELAAPFENSGWHAIAMVFNRANQSLSFYRDGLEAGRQTVADYPAFQNAAAMTLGGLSSGRHFLGVLDDVRIFNYAVPGHQITAQYLSDRTSGAEPPRHPEEPAGPIPESQAPIAHYALDGNAVDASGNHFDGALIGAAPAANRFGEPDKALLFNGFSDYLNLGNRPAFNFAGPFTLSVWIKAELGPFNNYFFGKYDANATAETALGSYGLGVRDGRAYAMMLGSAPGPEDLSAGPVLDENQWHALTMVSTGSELLLYRNGRPVGSRPLRSYPALQNSYPLMLGALVSGQFFKGTLDEVRIHNRALSATEVAAQYAGDRQAGPEVEPPVEPAEPSGPLPVSEAPIAYYRLDGNAVDESDNHFHGTMEGTTPIADRFGVPDKALLFNGRTDRIVLGNPPGFNMAGPFTLSVWVKIQAVQVANYILGKYDVQSVASRKSYGLGLGPSVRAYGFVSGSGPGYEDLSAGPGLNDNQWHALAMVYRVGGMALYLDGVQIGSRQGASHQAFQNSVPLVLGAVNSGQFFSGALDDIRIYNRALSAAELSAQYAAEAPSAPEDPVEPEDPWVAFPVSQSPIAYYPLDGDALDGSGNHFDGTIAGATPTENRRGELGKALFFRGASDRIDLGNPNAFNFEGAYTLSAWVKLGGPQESSYILGKYDLQAGYASANSYGLGLGPSTRAYCFVRGVGSGYVDLLGPGLNDGRWHAISTVYTGNFLWIYVDGDRVDSRPADSYGRLQNSVPLTIGGIHSGQFFTGAIDEVRIHNRALSKSEIQTQFIADLDLGPEPEVPADPGPSEPLPVSQNPIAYYRLDGNALDESENHLDGMLTGATPTENRFGEPGKALDFKGVPDRINLGNRAAFNFAGSFTLHVWVKLGASQYGKYIIGKYDGTDPGSPYSYGLGIGFGNPYGFVRGTGPGYADLLAGPALSDNRWHALALVYDGSDLRLYCDGTRVGSRPAPARGPFRNSVPLMIGGISSGQFFVGAIDEVAIYNRALPGAEIASLYLGEVPPDPEAPVDPDPSFEPLPVSQSPIANYALDGDAADQSGNHFHGTLVGTTPTADRFGQADKALLFNGGSDRINLGNRAAFNFPSGFTLSVWVKLTGDQNSRYIIGKYDGVTTSGYGLGIGIVENPYSFVRSAERTVEVGPAGTLNDGNWHALSMVFEANSRLSIYQDGLLHQASPAPFVSEMVNPLPLMIGGIASGQRFLGAIDDVRIYNRALTGEEIEGQFVNEAPPELLPLPPSVEPIAYYPLDGDATDRSPNHLDGILTGTTATFDRFGIAGKALFFNGLSDQVNLGNRPAFEFRGSFTLSAWIKLTGDQENRFIIAKSSKQFSTDFPGYGLGLTGSGSEYGFIRGMDGLPEATKTAGSLNDGKWHALALVYEKNSRLTIYRDGVARATRTVAGFPQLANSLPLILGARYADGYNRGPFGGSMDDVRIYNRALPEEEIAAQFAADKPDGAEFPPEPEPPAGSQTPIAYYPFDGNTLDAGENHLDGINYGATGVPDRYGRPNKAMFFAGASDIVTLGSHSQFLFYGSFTLSAWIKREGVTDAFFIGLPHSYGFGLTPDGKPQGYISGFDSFGDRIVAESSTTDGAWHAIALVCEADKKLLIYLDGALSRSIDIPPYPPIGNNSALLIGALPDDQIYTGALDDLRIYDRAVSAEEIAAQFAAEKPGPLVPEELPADPGAESLVAFYPLDGNALDAGAARLNGVLSGTAPAPDRFGRAGQALLFNGSSDSVNLGNPPAFNFQGGFTLSAWAKLSGAQSERYLIAKYGFVGAGLAPRAYGLGLANQGEAYAFVSHEWDSFSYQDLRGGSGLNDETWHQLTMVYEASARLSIYKDGALLVSTLVANYPALANDLPLTLGATSSGNFFGGAMDDVRIFNRVLTAREIAARFALENTPPVIDPEPEIPAAGLLAHYRFDGGATDATGNHLDGVATGTTAASDRFGAADKAFHFGGGAVVSLGTPELLNFSAGFTVAAWVMTDANLTDCFIIAKHSFDGTSGSANSFGFGIGPASDLYGFLSVTGTEREELLTGAPLSLSEWHAVAMTYQAADGRLSLYADGVLLNSRTVAERLPFSGVVPLTIGAAASGQNFTGGIDDVRLYDRALSAGEIEALFEAESP